MTVKWLYLNCFIYLRFCSKNGEFWWMSAFLKVFLARFRLPVQFFRNKNLERRWCMFSQVPKTSLSITHNQKEILDFDRIFPLHKIFEIDWIHVYIQEYTSIKYIEHAFPFCFSLNSRKFQFFKKMLNFDQKGHFGLFQATLKSKLRGSWINMFSQFLWHFDFRHFLSSHVNQ